MALPWLFPGSDRAENCGAPPEAWRVESDPDQTDRIVRPRRNDQLGRVMKLTLGRDGRAGVDAFVKSPVTFRLLYP